MVLRVSIDDLQQRLLALDAARANTAAPVRLLRSLNMPAGSHYVDVLPSLAQTWTGVAATGPDGSSLSRAQQID